MKNRLRRAVKSLSVMLLATVVMVAVHDECPGDVLIDCYDGTYGASPIYRGFYVPNYPGHTLDQVDLLVEGTQTNDFTIRLVVRENTYDGPLIGMADVDISIQQLPPTLYPVSFVFGSLPVTQSSTLTFVLEKIWGLGNISYANVTSNPECPIIQTEFHDPPLDTDWWTGARAVIHGSEATSSEGGAWGMVKTMYR